MSGKSIFLSILAMIVYVGAAVGVVYVFRYNLLMGFLGILLLVIPVMIQKKAVDEANGGFDKILAKYLVPAFAVVATLVIILMLYFFLK